MNFNSDINARFYVSWPCSLQIDVLPMMQTYQILLSHLHLHLKCIPGLALIAQRYTLRNMAFKLTSEGIIVLWRHHPLPKSSPDRKYVWPRHGSADLLGASYQIRSPPFVMWAFPAFEQGALAPLVFLPATFSIQVLPGDKLFQSRIVREDCVLAPVTHAFGGSKMRVGNKLQQAGGPPLPLVAAMRGVDDKLPFWACEDGCDFIRGTRLMNVTLKPQDIALSSLATYCLLSLWKVIFPTLLQPALFSSAQYTAPLIDLPDCLPKLGDSAYVLLSRVTSLSSSVLLDSIQSVWKEWGTPERNTFQIQWIATINC